MLSSIVRLIGAIFPVEPRTILCLILSLLALQGLQAAEIFEIEPIPGTLLRLQSQEQKDEKPSLFVNNLDKETLLALTRKPAQAVLIQHTAAGYAVWNHAQAAPGESLEIGMDFSIPRATREGTLMFGGFRGDRPMERKYAPTARVGFNADKKLVFSYGALAKNDWKELQHPPLKFGKTYHVTIRIHSNAQGAAVHWDVRLSDGATVIASMDQIPIEPGSSTPFSGVFLQSNAADPVLVEKVSFGGSKRVPAEADFQAPKYAKDSPLEGQAGWTGNVAAKIQVVESAKALAPYITAKPEFGIYLSKDRYAAEDVHLDAVCVLPGENAEAADSVIDLQLRSADGKVIAEKKGIAPPSSQFAIYWSLPQAAIGQKTELQAEIRNKKTSESANVRIPFTVDAVRTVATQGEIALHVPGRDKLAGAVIPYSVGVPFPRGALPDTSRLRLVGENGAEIPASFHLDGRWSRFGSVRWLNCSFSLPVPRQALKLKLQYGVGEVGSPIVPPAAPVPWDGKFAAASVTLDPLADGPAGAVAEGGGQRFHLGVIASRGVPLLRTSSLSGSYVIDGTGKSFTVNPSQKFIVEQSDSQQTILRQQGWYEAADKTRFCQYDNRITLFKNTPLMRVEHGWTFTGDGNQDTISEMGWRFSAAGECGAGAFWNPGGDFGEWFSGQSLLQYGFANAALRGTDNDKETELDHRSEGIARLSARADKPNVHFGVKDFWQNYPAELIFDKAGFSVLTWPRDGRECSGPASLSDFYQLKFIHSGKNLTFRLPEEYLKGPIYSGTEKHYLEGKAESANAQGISKTTEIWVMLGGTAEAGTLVHALCDRSLSAFVDPEWLAASGVFHEIHAKDTEEFPREEAVYESVALAPERWAEHMGVYGKWIWGGVLSGSDLAKKKTTPFRTYRKAHQGWPYSWLPYARSGDVRFRRFAEANTRQMADVNFCRFSDDKSPRPLGFWNRSLIPWTFVYGPTTRHYADKVDYLWHAWHLAGDYRAREAAELWAAATKTDKMPIMPWSGNRRSVNMLRTYVDAYQESLDPWFIPAYREVAKLHQGMAAQSDNPEFYQLGGASFWSSGPREYLRFTGDPSYLPLYLSYAKYWAKESCENVWVQFGVVMLEPLSFAYELTRDPYYARRIRGQLDWADAAVYKGPEEWMKGYNITGKDSSAQAPLFAGYFLSHFPFAEKVLAEAKTGADSIPNNLYVLPGFNSRPTGNGSPDFVYPRIYVEKATAQPVPLFFDLQFPDKDAKPWTYKVRQEQRDASTVAEGQLVADTRPNYSNTPTAKIPGSSPAGSYTIDVQHEFDPEIAQVTWGHGPGLMIPISPTGNREVISWPRGRYLPPLCFQAQLWFRWPGDEPTLTVRFHYPTMANETQHPVIKNAAGKVIWEKEFLSDSHMTGQIQECRLNRPDFGSDGMVHLIFPGRDVRLTVEGEGDLFYAVSPQRWFQPSSSSSSALVQTRTERKLPVAVVGTGRIRPITEQALTRAGVWIDKSVTGNILHPADYGQYSAIVFAGLINGECAWDKPENRDRVRQWISQGGIAVVLSLGSVPRLAKPQLDLQGLDEFLGFTKAVNFQPKILGLLKPANDRIFESLTAEQREKGIPWNWPNAGKPSVLAAAKEITTAEILAGTEGLGMITVNHIGKGKVYYLGCNFPLPKENVPEADAKAISDALTNALKP